MRPSTAAPARPRAAVPSRAATWLLLAAVALLPACVTRKLFVNSEPPGAEVILDGRSVGTTPYEETFLSYGVRRLELRLPGYGRHIQLVDLERPWWQVFPMSLVTDVFWPWELLDEHFVDVPLHTLEAMDSQQIHEAAQGAHDLLRTMRAINRGETPAENGPR